GFVASAGSLHPAAYGRAVVKRRLHGPDLIALGTEGLRGVLFHTHVDDGRTSAGIDNEIADVIVIVTFGVVSTLGGKVEPARRAFFETRSHDLDSGEPCV